MVVAQPFDTTFQFPFFSKPHTWSSLLNRKWQYGQKNVKNSAINICKTSAQYFKGLEPTFLEIFFSPFEKNIQKANKVNSESFQNCTFLHIFLSTILGEFKHPLFYGFYGLDIFLQFSQIYDVFSRKIRLHSIANSAG